MERGREKHKVEDDSLHCKFWVDILLLPSESNIKYFPSIKKVLVAWRTFDVSYYLPSFQIHIKSVSQII